MNRLITSNEKLIDVQDAGTTMRFLTSYFGATGKNKVLTGTPRMKQRPIGLLTDALIEIGVDVKFLENPGFPPHEILAFPSQKSNTISIDGNVSSQFISALMMIGPTLPLGLAIHLKGKVGSRPYIEMTAELMKQFGVGIIWTGSVIEIKPQAYQPANITVESDWSAASYWFAMTALAENAEITLPNITEKSIQGDRAIAGIMKELGVETKFSGGQAILTKTVAAREIKCDFSDCPDLAQTILPVCAVKNISGEFTGMESLRIKETDRISALQTELSKIGSSITEHRGKWRIEPGFKRPENLSFNTYHDHRMAMGLAPIATQMAVEIEDAEVVNKSYPGFWRDLQTFGFGIQELS